MHDVASWRAAVCSRLWQLQADGVGWGYGVSEPPYTEPTVLACLALLASADGTPSLETWEAVDACAEYLSRLQQSDGAVGVAAGIATPHWPTAYAALLWSQIPGYDRPLACALRWLQQDGWAARYFSDEQIVDGDMRWWPDLPLRAAEARIIPASLAVLALCRNQLAGHVRVQDGVRWILDSALPHGGWAAEGSLHTEGETYPQAAATGIALLALRAANRDESHVVTDACYCLARVLASTESPAMFGWAWLGYHAWHSRTAESWQWLSRVMQWPIARAEDPAGLAMLLLAGSPDALTLLGVSAATNASSCSPGLAQELLGI